jgi:hypothetical protein
VRAKFEGSFATVTKMGADYQIHERFKPLHGEGKPLWEFKEHGHRLYCIRVTGAAGSVTIVLLNGWKKDKVGRGANEERQKIKNAQRLREEYVKRGTGGVK